MDDTELSTIVKDYIAQSVAKEFNQADAGTGILKRKAGRWKK